MYRSCYKFFFFLFIIHLPLNNCLAQNNRIWATYFGGERSELIPDICTDPLNNVYIAGTTNSSTGIAYNGFKNSYSGNQDGYIAKFDPSGNIIWATYFGDSGDDVINDIKTDELGNVYITGYTENNSSISYNGYQNSFGGGRYDAILAKYDSNGILIWCTYYGGSGNEYGTEIDISAKGNVFLVGYTNSSNAIAHNGFDNSFNGGLGDAYLVKFDNNGYPIWGTYYGGTGVDYARAIRTDKNENIYFTGYSASIFNIAYNASQNNYGGGQEDMILVKFDTYGIRKWATYFGGQGQDNGWGVDIDENGVYVVGGTSSTAGIANLGYQNNFGGGPFDGYIAKFDTLGNKVWSSYFGGEDDDATYQIVLDKCGYFYICGDTHSMNGIAYSGFQNNSSSTYDCYLAKFDINGNRIRSTYYGTSGRYPNYRGAVALDGMENVFLSGVASNSGMAYNGYQNSVNGDEDNFLVKFTTACEKPPIADISGKSTICAGQKDTLLAIGCGKYLWSNNETTETIVVSPANATTYSLVVSNQCGSDTSVFVVNTISPQDASFSYSSSAFCHDSILVNPIFTNGQNGIFSANDNSLSIDSNTAIVNIFGSLPGTYTITNYVAASQYCPAVIFDLTFTITANQTASFDYINLAHCQNTANLLPVYFNDGIAGNFLSSQGLNISANSGEINLKESSPGTYTVINSVPAYGGCPADTAITTIRILPISANAGNDMTIKANSSIQLFGSGGTQYLWSPTEGLNCDTCQNPIASPLKTTVYKLTVADTNGCRATDDVTITIDCGEIFVPNIFSPNHDGHNDLECVFGNCVESFSFMIFDRWGEKVFETNDKQQCWDGTYRGTQLDNAVFVYYLTATIAGEKISKKGNISLVR